MTVNQKYLDTPEIPLLIPDTLKITLVLSKDVYVLLGNASMNSTRLHMTSVKVCIRYANELQQCQAATQLQLICKSKPPGSSSTENDILAQMETKSDDDEVEVVEIEIVRTETNELKTEQTIRELGSF